MNPDPQLASAIRAIAGSQHGRLLVEYLEALLEEDRAQLVMQEHPEQLRRIQGQARRTLELLRMFGK